MSAAVPKVWVIPVVRSVVVVFFLSIDWALNVPPTPG